MRQGSSPIAIALGLVGLSACVVAGAVNGATIERMLIGASTGQLTWGPDLFRLLLFGHGAVLVGVCLQLRRLALPATGGTPTERSEPWSLAALATLSVVAFGLRLWQLDSCLWFDEVLTVVDFVRPSLGQIVTSFPSQNQHMLFSVLAHGSVALFGESAWALRLPSVAFGVASIGALFLLGRQLIGRREALLACALATVSYHHVWFSQNARGYMGLLFFTILATWLWLESRRRPRWLSYAAYAITLALGMWTHLTMVFVPISHALLLALETVGTSRRKPLTLLFADLRQPLVAWLLGATLTVQLYALSLPEFLRTGLHEVSLESEWTSPLWVIRESLRNLHVGFGALSAVLVALGVGLAGCVDLVRRDRMAFWSMILPPVLGGALMLALGHNLWPRFFFFAMGFAILIAVHGTVATPRALLSLLLAPTRATSIGTTVGVALIFCMITLSLWTLPRVYALPKQDFVGARDYVERERAPGDGIVAVGLAGVAYQRYFAPEWVFADSAAEIEAVRAAHPRVWLVYTIPVELRAYRPEVWKVVADDFESVRIFPGTLGGGEVHVCRERLSAETRHAADQAGRASRP